MNAPLVLLNNGLGIPQIGLGTWPLTDAEVAPAIVTAVEAGYRHLDTAVKYGNETGVGRGIRDSGIAREELFVTTKLNGAYQGDDKAIAGLDDSLARLGLDYIDLLLIHWPVPQRGLFVSTWQTFEALVASGKARSIGVSNFKPAHLDRLLAEAGIVPAVNQIELNPYVTRAEQREYNAAHGIVTESWSPLGQGTELLDEPLLGFLAEKYEKTPAQIVLRWHIELGLVAIPKSRTPERILQNIDVFDFTLDPTDVEALTALDQGPEAGVDSDVIGH
ncbi:aldo/keto reductase [Cryobacterium tagatosivorans]|uniref:Aldo/keto reductase n=1 Tax=Cryobacterium tagatosivorans TaxID=1259199 RepID=A0A4R8UAH7_9MICO|nr:aldo/keto reductase [Cryobacterium tagatosivorans]TFB46284.1 aldo/keto reductase [Cryobacterium tagatosivorans]